ncbi:MAG: NifU family protein [Gemmatimonadota bacterium]
MGNGSGMTDTATSGTSGILRKIEDVLASIRPAVRQDGGDIEFVEFDRASGRVKVRMVGACYACPMSMATLRAGVEQRLRTVVPEVRSVEAI